MGPRRRAVRTVADPGVWEKGCTNTVITSSPMEPGAAGKAEAGHTAITEPRTLPPFES